ncbi:MAG: ABC transporter ATP-binding protein [Clostridium sp.]|jgi:iron chelate uptake ABC transporter|uniref:ABC transporter ATP-binding protein n=1 Tax=Clostridium sp. TaxID=1506 RepID=UPI0025DABD91|nr:ABC transporter ATP-binding protein [Clostridium sp.]MDY6226672.1 ABC transporter ATP-binding protein [Clostridium sp.]
MLEVKNIYCGYNGEDVVKNVSFKVSRGENICIVGPNGCGKSTLLKAIANLLSFKGQILLDGKDTKLLKRKELATKVSLMNQSSNILFPYSIYETVALGRYAHLNGVFSRLSKNDDEIINKSLDKVGILDIKDKLISELSGGQLQRVFLARTFAQDPDVIILDEPTNHLDLRYQIEILDYLKLWAKENNKIVVAVLHDLNLVQNFGDKVLMLKEGTLINNGETKEVLNGKDLEKVYGIDIKSFMLRTLNKWR